MKTDRILKLIHQKKVMRSGGALPLPKAQDGRELKFNEIPTQDGKKIVIDNYSPKYDYVVEGDKVYYKSKKGETWADISDNKVARYNLLDFINKNNYWAGYGEAEKDLYNDTQFLMGLAPKGFETFKNLKEMSPFFREPEVDEYGQLKGTISSKTPPKQEPFRYTVTPTETSGSGSSIIPVLAKDEESLGIDDVFETFSKGVSRKWKTQITGEDDDPIVASNKVAPPKSVEEYYSGITSNYTIIPTPDKSGRQYKQQTLPLSNITFGARNRGEYEPIETDGLEVTTFHPFTDGKDFKETQSVIALDPKGKIHTGTYKEFKNNKGWVFTPTIKNKVIDFAEENGEQKFMSAKTTGNPRYMHPMAKYLTDDGKVKEGYVNLLIAKKDKPNAYGGVQGGRVLVVDPKTKEKYLISGTLDHMKSEFRRIKGDKEFLEVYTLDNGTYNRGLSYSDRKLTPERLKSYDNDNVSGGSGLYIKSYDKPLNRYKEEYIQTPNIRTEEDSSFIMGHPLRNEIKNVVLHHTAFVDEAKNEQQVKSQFMRPRRPTGAPGVGTQASAATAHVVIEEDGKRTVYASPEQVSLHAGISSWKGRDNVNDFSIGVEFQGDTERKPLTNAQIDSFIEYYTPIAREYNLSLNDVITHAMISPGRKPDITDTEYKRILRYLRKKGFMQPGGQSGEDLQYVPNDTYGNYYDPNTQQYIPQIYLPEFTVTADRTIPFQDGKFAPFLASRGMAENSVFDDPIAMGMFGAFRAGKPLVEGLKQFGKNIGSEAASQATYGLSDLTAGVAKGVPIKIDPKKWEDAKGYLRRRQFIKGLQEKNLVGKEFNLDDLNYAARSGDKTNKLTQLALDRYNTGFRRVSGHVPHDGVGASGYRNQYGYNMNIQHYGRPRSEFENMELAGVDFDDPLSIAEYQATHIPMEDYGYRATGEHPTHEYGFIFRSDVPFHRNDYGDYLFKGLPGTDYSTGTYKDWLRKYYEDIPLHVTKDKYGASQWGWGRNTGEKLTEARRWHRGDPTLVGPRGIKAYEIDKSFPFTGNSTLYTINDLRKYIENYGKQFDTGWRGEYYKGGLTSSKAREILHDKSVHGNPLTDKQRRFFGAIASGKKIRIKKNK